MKIGLVLDDSLDSSDGVQQYVLTIGRYFTQQGHDVHYLVGQTSRTDLKNIHSLSKNVSVRFNGNRMTMPLPGSGRKISHLLRQQKFDVLHVQMPYSPFMAAQIINRAPKNTVVVGTFHILPYGWLQTAGAKLLRLMLWRSLPKIQQVWSVSPPAADFASSLGIKSSVLPNAVDIKHFAGQPAQTQQFKIVFLGRLVERKGASQLISAVMEFVSKHQDAKISLRIGGTGPELASLRHQAKRLPAGLISFDGYIDEAAKPKYLSQASVAVFPSLGAESFGIVLVEAMAASAGVVLGGNNPGYSSVLASTPEALFDPRQPSQLARLLADLYSSADLRQKLHQQQQKTVKQYDVAKVCQKLLSYYQELIAKNRENL